MIDVESLIASDVKGAVIDPEWPDYRYLLWRQMAVPAPDDPVRWCTFIMLNPSTADANEDDPTIRRCKSLARDAFHCHGIVVVNLFAFRATDPSELLDHPHPVGPLNDDYIEQAVAIADVVVCAWGWKGDLKFWGGEHRGRDYALKLQNMHPKVRCLGRTKNGSPRHPLYVRADVIPEPFPESRRPCPE